MTSKALIYIIPALLFSTSIRCDGDAQQQLLKSPCPEVFQFDSQEEGKWNATLQIRAPHILKGLWIKLYFDQDVDEFLVQESYGGEVVILDDPANRGFLIKNPDAILNGGSDIGGRQVQISVSYSGRAPNIQEFRINGYPVCPNVNANRTDFYPNDPQAALANYLESIASNAGLYSSNECGKYEGASNFPWQAALFTTDGKNFNYTCEAVLISPNYLATSAHCVSYLNTRMPLLPEKLAVYFNVENINDAEKNQPFFISRVILYPGYQPQNLLNDIALLQLRNPSELKAIPACLASARLDEKAEEILIGYTLENGKFASLASAKLQNIPQENCFKTEALKAFLGDNTYCASYVDEKSTSIGDSGSGAYSRSGDQCELRGLLTLGGALLKDNSRNILLTDVYKYDKWIRKALVS